MKSQSIKQRNKQKKQKTPRTFDDLGSPAKTVAEKKLSPLFFNCIPTENNVVQFWFTRVVQERS